MISNPNLVSQIAKLPHLSDDQLKAYITDKSNPLSPFALATLQSKAIARKKFGTPETPKQTVADQVEAEASAPLGAEQGLGGLPPQGAPAPQMAPPQAPPMAPPPQGMAGGGMVAFEEGGLSALPIRDDMYADESYAGGGIVSFAGGGSPIDYEGLTQAKFDALSPEDQQQYTNVYRNKQLLGNHVKGALSPGVLGGGLMFNAVRGIGNELVPLGQSLGIVDPLYKGAPYYSMAELTPDFGSTPKTPAELRALLPASANIGNASPQTGQPPNSDYAARQKAYFANYAKNQAPVAAPVHIGNGGGKASAGISGLNVNAGQGGDPYKIERANVEHMPTPEDFNISDYGRKSKEAFIAMGGDDKYFDKQKAKNETDREALKGEKTTAGWNAGLRAGLSMMGGKSTNPWVNIGEGANAGLTQYGTDVKDIKADEKALRLADDKLAEAQYLQSRGDAEGAMKAYAEREKLIQSTKAVNMAADNAANTAFVGDKNKLTENKFKEANENRRHEETVALQRRANEIAAENKILAKNKDIAMQYATIESKAKSDVDSQIKNVTEFQGGVSKPQLDKMVRDTILRYQRDAGLPPLSSPDGWGYIGPMPTAKPPKK
jgi:hypothetical protein